MRVFAAFVVVAAVAAGGSSAARQPPVSLPFSIAFFDARHGVMGTERTIETTRDGGRTWTIQYSGTGPYRIVEERRGNDVWAIGYRHYLHSADRGVTWRRYPRRPVSGVAFGSPLLDWDVNQRELPTGETMAWLSETRDGGRSWRRVSRVCHTRDFAFDFAGLSQVSATRGWVLCVSQPGLGMQLKAVFETQNGGRSWELRACACGRSHNRGRLSGLGYGGRIEFTPEGDGALFLTRTVPITLTHDRGRSWTRWVGRADIDSGLDASIVSSRLIYALAGEDGERARLLVSRDGGRSWGVLRRWGSTRG